MALGLPYVEQGDVEGVPVILLHAYADSWRSFERVLPHLPASIRAFAVTQRGHGDAPKPPNGYGIEDFAGDLLAFLDTVGLERAVLVASSSAAFTAQRLAVDHSGRVLGLVLIGVPWSLREKASSLDFVRAIAGLRDPVDPEFVRGFVEATSSERVPAAFRESMVAESMKMPARAWRGVLEGLLEAPPPAAGAIAAPTLLVWGDRDETVPLADQERLVEAIPRSRLVVYEGAGHLVHWEEPERIAADISAFALETAGGYSPSLRG